MTASITMEQLMEAQVELSVENIGWGAMLLSEMDAMRETKHLCDISIMVTDGTLIPAHSLVLSAASSFFKQVLDKARKSNPSVNTVVLKCSFTADVIHSVFDFLYKGKALPLLSQIPEIQRAAKTFGIDSLLSLCQVFTSKNSIHVTSNTEVVEEEGTEQSIVTEQEAEMSMGETEEVDSMEMDGDIPEFGDDVGAQEVINRAVGHTANSVGLPRGREVMGEDKETGITTLRILQPDSIRQNVVEEYDVKTSIRKLYRYSCDMCDRIFTSRCRLEGHRATHTGEKLHKCNICGAEFIQIEYLREHKSIHMPGKPYKCDVCGMKFRILRHLKKHANIHSDRKRFVCCVCNAAFRRSDGYRNHMRTHTGDKPYQCKICQKRFPAADNLKRHLLIHSDKKPFRCNVCERGFVRKDALRKHQMIHTGEYPFPCKVEGCPGVFRLAPQLRRHTRIFHSDDAEANASAANDVANVQKRIFRKKLLRRKKLRKLQKLREESGTNASLKAGETEAEPESKDTEETITQSEQREESKSEPEDKDTQTDSNIIEYIVVAPSNADKFEESKETDVIVAETKQGECVEENEANLTEQVVV